MPYRKNPYNVTVPHSSGFDKSHRYTGTGCCGSLIPVLCDEVIPGTKVRLRVPMSVQLPPLASETYMNASIKYEAFFVPMRLCSASFESFFNDFPERVQVTNVASGWSDLKGVLPAFRIPLSTPLGSGDIISPGTLMDYLGFVSRPLDAAQMVDLNPLPLVAYHLIWQEWYRNPRVQNPAFSKTLTVSHGNVNSHKASIIPSTFYHDGDGSSVVSNYLWDATSSFELADGKSIFDLRQRNFGLDYFTGARTSAQQGAAAGVSISVDSLGNGTMTIAALRAANSLQQFRERNNLASPRFVDQIQDRYGVRPSDGVAQRPICIGSSTIDISTRGVDQTASGIVGSAESIGTNNPFQAVAAQYGRGQAASNDFLIDNFEALEPGYIMVMQSLVPEVTYTVGVESMFQRYVGPDSIVQMANPLLQNVGDQPIYAREITGYQSAYAGNVFGYTDRFAEFMFRKNTVHGRMRNDVNGSLRSFVLQRDFSTATAVTLSSKFLEIPPDYLDQIFAVNSEVSGLSYWFDIYFDYKVTMPLAEFSIPSLQDPAYEHGKQISIRRNGQIF